MNCNCSDCCDTPVETKSRIEKLRIMNDIYDSKVGSAIKKYKLSEIKSTCPELDPFPTMIYFTDGIDRQIESNYIEFSSNLYYHQKNINSLISCVDKYILIETIIFTKNINEPHTNYVIIDKINRAIMRYEPYGSAGDWYNQRDLDGNLSSFFSSIFKEFNYYGTDDTCPIGIQEIIERTGDKLYDFELGYCDIMSILFMVAIIKGHVNTKDKTSREIYSEYMSYVMSISGGNLLKYIRDQVVDIYDKYYEIEQSGGKVINYHQIYVKYLKKYMNI